MHPVPIGFHFDPDFCSRHNASQGERERYAALQHEIDRDLPVAFQVMIALENLGEQVFADDRSSRSILELELNKRDALRYLNKM